MTGSASKAENVPNFTKPRFPKKGVGKFSKNYIYEITKASAFEWYASLVLSPSDPFQRTVRGQQPSHPTPPYPRLADCRRLLGRPCPSAQSASQTTDGRRRWVRPACAAAHCRRPCATPGRTQDDGRPDGDGTRRAPDCSAVTLPSAQAGCQSDGTADSGST